MLYFDNRSCWMRKMTLKELHLKSKFWKLTLTEKVFEVKMNKLRGSYLLYKQELDSVLYNWS